MREIDQVLSAGVRNLRYRHHFHTHDIQGIMGKIPHSTSILHAEKIYPKSKVAGKVYLLSTVCSRNCMELSGTSGISTRAMQHWCHDRHYNGPTEITHLAHRNRSSR